MAKRPSLARSVSQVVRTEINEMRKQWLEENDGEEGKGNSR